MSYPIIKLSAGKEEIVKRFHPWIFSGAIKSASSNLRAGDLVRVVDTQDNVLGIGFCEAGSIAVKLLSFCDVIVNKAFWREKLQMAINSRISMGLINNPNTECFRLVHSEGDGLPGLIVDVYGCVAVFQAQTEGMLLHIKEIADALLECNGLKIKAIYNKSQEAMKRMGKESSADDYLYGSSADSAPSVLENDCKYLIDWESGQKTGFFLDQRNNRALVGRYSAGRRVLNTFCYTGGFSVAALRGGAKQAVSVDCSGKAIDICAKNLELNGFEAGQANPCIVEDAKKYLQTMPFGAYDLIVLDPPAFAKNRRNLVPALSAYKYINSEAIKKIASGGLLFTFSCSQAVDSNQFQSTVMAAAIEAGRKVQILHNLTQGEDHPVSIFHPEGSYLKGLVLNIFN